MNVGCYYLFGIPIGLTLGYKMELGVKVCIILNSNHLIQNLMWIHTNTGYMDGNANGNSSSDLCSTFDDL